MRIIAIAFSVGTGFVGAGAHQSFDWRLAAEVGTALGTIMLAVYTAWLARTTRQEVSVAIEDQRSRDRPVVVAVKKEIGQATLEQWFGQQAPTLTVDLQNVGSGPAFDIRLRARHAGNAGVTEAVIPVMAVGASWPDYEVSLSSIEQPDDGFRVEDFSVEGDFTDRTGGERHDIRVLVAKGLRDEQRVAHREAEMRAWISLSMRGAPTLNPANVVYPVTLSNNAPGNASNVRVQCRDTEGNNFPDPFAVGDIESRRSVDTDFHLPREHPTLSCLITWTDGIGEGQFDCPAFLPARRD